MEMSDAAHRADVAAFKESILRHVRYSLGREWEELSEAELFSAVSMAVRDRILDRMLETERRVAAEDSKRVYYLSMEFLMGRALSNNLHNLGLYDICRDALVNMGVDLEEVAESEVDAALGNGGLGRLAACFLDSMASLGLPGWGYGINYEFGLFRQEIKSGWQRERPDAWRANGSPWLLERPDDAVMIPVYGRIDHTVDRDGEYNPMWLDWRIVVGVPSDMPIVGHGGETVNTLRLYSAAASDDFDIEIFNGGDYLEAVKHQVENEAISKVLYPSDAVESGRELRVLQEYFFVACALHDILQRFTRDGRPLAELPDKVAIQLNDTHPALGIAELMRLLCDEHRLSWAEAWDITTSVFAYTNHTLLPEALEVWPEGLLERVVPRHLQIIREIDARFRAEVEAHFPGDADKLNEMGIVVDGNVRMAHLAIVGSHTVNGVAALHSELVKTDLVPSFHAMWPQKFQNKTNGVTQRRWLLACNPDLSDLVSGTLGTDWIHDLDRLRALEAHVEDVGFRDEFMRIKRMNKRRLVRLIGEEVGTAVDPTSLFDVQIKRIHQYKRQLLLCMYMAHEYFRIVEDGVTPLVPRTFVVAGKAAPGYWAAKQIIKLIHAIGDVVNADPRVGDALRVVFVPDYRVSIAERIVPAADLSEQISTAGMEASGTGNMKLAMNGALTIGTLDGANVEIREEVGDENIFIFGKRVEEIAELREAGSYDPRAIADADPNIKRVVESFSNGAWSPDDHGRFAWIAESLLDAGDIYYHLADFGSYVETQGQVGELFDRTDDWARKAILNVARIGKFSSDRTIREYASEIWGLSHERMRI